MDSWINQNVSLSNLNASSRVGRAGALAVSPAWPTCSISAPAIRPRRNCRSRANSSTCTASIPVRPLSLRTNQTPPPCGAAHDAVQHRPVLAGQDAVVPPGRGGRLPPAAAGHRVRPLQLLRLPGRLRLDQRSGQHGPGRNEQPTFYKLSSVRCGRLVGQQVFCCPTGVQSARSSKGGSRSRLPPLVSLPGFCRPGGTIEDDGLSESRSDG